MIYKNVASQKLAVYAWDSINDSGKTADAANITAQISLDGAATAATNDANPTELDATDAPGIYIFDLTQAETNADMIVLSAVSATADILIEPIIIYTADLNDLSAAEVNAEVDSAIETYHLDHLLAATYDPASKPGASDALLNELVENDGGVPRYTANSLEQAPTGGSNPNVLVDTTIGTVNSQTEFTLSAGSDQNDAYNDQIIVLYDADNSDYPSVRTVSDYVGSTKTLTIDSAAEFTIVSGDAVKVFVTTPSTAPSPIQGAIEYTYTIDDGSNPIDGVEVWISTDSGGTNIIWSGVSDANGIARDASDEKPWLDAGTYYAFAQKAGYTFTNPDTLTVS